jgi:phosphoglycerate dehydrogenase-like enzyme
MIGAAQIDLLPPSAIIINTARGEVIDEQALISALLRSFPRLPQLKVHNDYQ